MTKEKMEEAAKHLKDLHEALKHAIHGEKHYRIPITFDNHHNGDDEHSEQHVWAKSKDQAISEATNGPHGKWCSVDGSVTIIQHTPEFDDALISAILALPKPL